MREFFSRINLTKAEVEVFRNQPNCVSLFPYIEQPDSINQVWPKGWKKDWSRDNFGPIIIPRQGLVFSEQSTYTDLYLPTARTLQLPPDITIVPENYYFVLGDNRHESMDSRFFGLVPESSIHGKASIILFSNDKRKPYFNRFIKLLE